MTEYNINVAVLGTVSSGKSTLLNSLFLEEFATMKISRNTMVPQIYREAMNNKISTIKEAKIINKEISEINDNIIELSKDSSYNISSDFKEIEFYIHKLKELNFLQKDVYFSFYDIPGVNDVKNHEIYYKYVRENFDKFDVIIYLINLESGINTKDELDLLNLICKKTSISNKKFIIPIINKSDNMTMSEGKINCDSKYINNYDNILNILNEYNDKYNVRNCFTKPILYSAQEAFMYRILYKNPDYELSEENKNIIGLNEMGKKYYILSNEERNIKFKEIINDKIFIKTMVKMSGYNELYETLKNTLDIQNQKILCSNKLLNKLMHLQSIKIDKSNIINIYNKFDSIFNKYEHLQKIYNFEFDFTDKNKFIVESFNNVMEHIPTNDIDELLSLQLCLGNIKFHKYNVELTNELYNTDKKIKESIYNYYVEHYEKKLSLEDLLYVLEQLENNSIDKFDEYFMTYFSEIIQLKTDYYSYVDFSNFKSIIKFDNNYKLTLDKLKKFINKNSLEKIYKYIVKNKIQTLIKNIKSDNNIISNMTIFYNLMLFYNYYSTKNIEYSEIYTFLLSNYIGLINIKNFESLEFDKNDLLLEIDNEYIKL